MQWTYYTGTLHVDQKDLKIKGISFLKTDHNAVKSLMSEYFKQEKKIKPLLRREKKKNAKGKQSNFKSEWSRACGLFLWDSVYIEGKTKGDAIKELTEVQGSLFALTETETSHNEDAVMYRWLRIADRCIRENLVLSMKGF